MATKVKKASIYAHTTPEEELPEVDGATAASGEKAKPDEVGEEEEVLEVTLMASFCPKAQ